MSQVNKRHQLVLLFSDLADSTGIAAQYEPEQYGELLAQLRRQVTTIVERHGGEVVRIDGDGVLCIFGYPIAHEDAGRRAVEAALDLHAAVSALELASAGPAPHLRMHSGIHAGVVLLRSGDVVRGRYEMLGDATNVAARLCDAAGAGGILVSSETLGADRHFFRTGPSTPVTISGRGTPIDAWPIEGRAATPNRFAARASAGLTPFVGRDAQRREILHWLDAPGSEPAVLILHGPPGIGKSRLLSETAKEARAAGWTVESGYCEAYLGAPPLQPFVQVQQSIDPGNAASAAELARLLGDVAAKTPLLVMIDDWQWADDASRDLLRMLSEACAGGSARLKFLLTSREEHDPQTAEFACAALPVPPLGSDDVSSTIARLLKGADPFSARRIEAAAGGSPLLLEELCHAFAAGKAAPAGDPRGAWFDLAVQARFSELPADDARLLRLAAVIGHSVPLGLLAAVWGNALDPRMLERLRTADFLFKGERPDTLRFKHGLTRDAVYSGIGLNERRDCHRAVFDTLRDQLDPSAPGAADPMAYHAVEAGLHEVGMRLSLSAGDAALLAGALDRAQAHFAAAFKSYCALAPKPAGGPTLGDIVVRYGRACVIDPAPDQVAVLRAMIVLIQEHEPDYAADATYWLATIHFGLGNAKAAISELKEGLALARRLGRQGLAAQAQASLGASWFDVGAADTAFDLLSEACRQMRARLTENNKPALFYAMANLAQIHADQGDFGEAYSLFEEIERLRDACDFPVQSSLMTQQAAIQIWKGDFAQAAWFGALAEQFGIRDRSRQNAMLGAALRAYAEFNIGGEAKQADAFLEALHWLDRSNYRHRISLFHGWGADLLARTGQVQEARKVAAKAFARARYGDSFGVSTAARALAWLAACGHGRRSCDHYLKLADRSDFMRQSAWSMAETEFCRARIAELQGDPAKAASHAAGAQDRFIQLGMAERARAALALREAMSSR